MDEFSSTADPSRGPWRRVARWTLLGIASLGVLSLLAGAALWLYADSRIHRRVIDAILDRGAAAEAREPERLNFLVVGNDSREGLTEEQRRELRTGSFDGARTDTILLVQVDGARGRATVVSFPRDLRIERLDGITKINALVAEGGPDLLVAEVERLAGLQIDHYVEVSIPAFLSIIDVVGTVELCLDEPLQDDKSGADFEAGCQRMDPAESLAYVRSRQGAAGDFERIDRQQRFMAALVDEVLRARNLLDPTRLVPIVDRVASNLVTDEGLSLNRMRHLAQQLREVIGGGLRARAVPSYPQEIDGASYVLPYGPGAAALFEALRKGEEPDTVGAREERAETRVLVWTAGNDAGTEPALGTLFAAGFAAEPDGHGEVDGSYVTTVYSTGVDDERAGWVANLLGAPLMDLPEDVDAPHGAVAIVVLGRDAGVTDEGS
ncbi:MAG: LCP family protein [Nitriliruptorales bacterium]